MQIQSLLGMEAGSFSTPNHLMVQSKTGKKIMQFRVCLRKSFLYFKSPVHANNEVRKLLIIL